MTDNTTAITISPHYYNIPFCVCATLTRHKTSLSTRSPPPFPTFATPLFLSYTLPPPRTLCASLVFYRFLFFSCISLTGFIRVPLLSVTTICPRCQILIVFYRFQSASNFLDEHESKGSCPRSSGVGPCHALSTTNLKTKIVHLSRNIVHTTVGQRRKRRIVNNERDVM
ncbi:hypothetical protein FA15DRAFT_490732 [Coprinopsis marcescibilis]|uniref:Uncharacterized protein n=1 Tax=Coprinopsis marcescibilis TaxID=230819 RepID=A0A5C3KRE4_COPMA|nr:hypothetical protein FA15DRAFT_490732 [Coprinopsis marcescibilis]